jgi:Holliday junction resolvase RusA-like endonuclease
MRFYHSGVPTAKKRHRMGKKGAYDPQYSEKMNLKWAFASQFRQQGCLNALQGPVSLQMIVRCPIPKSWSKKRKRNALGRFVSSKPDLDNYEKMYFDVLNGIAYKDDSQIASIFSQKIYSDKPSIEINLFPLEETMITEHAISYKEKLSMEDLTYLISKANKLGLNNREIFTISQEEDKEGFHVYFKVTGLKEKEND